MGDDSFGQLLTRLYRRAWLQCVLWTLPGSLLISLIVWLINPRLITWSVLVSPFIVLMVCRWREPLFKVDGPALAAHINRVVPELEESAGLWLSGMDAPNVLQRLQRDRVAVHCCAILDSPERWLPPLRWRVPIVISSVGLMVFALFSSQQFHRFSEAAKAPEQRPAALFSLELVSVDVVPPTYTQLEPYTVGDYQLQVPQGSEVRWHLRANRDEALRVVASDAQRTERIFLLEQDQTNVLSAGAVFSATSLYRIERDSGLGFESLPGVYSVSVELDRAPSLRLLEPRTTRLEFGRDQQPVFDYVVAIEDDYGISDVRILASVAKGSGEGVKFRDETFTFSQQSEVDGISTYARSWNLEVLGMEPGDEIYLFTTATDNQPGEGQLARSETLVVRWLDEEPEVAAAEGLAISVMPEYFKSQRQIIIETEQLIADRAMLSDEEFVATARDLGLAQSELKERYGQYLGDEFDESEAPDGLLAEPEDETDHAAESEHDHAGEADSHGHEHGEPAFEAAVLPPSAEGLMARFGHDHGAAEIGIITKQSPVGLMKRSVAYMWDAELKLRLADPEGALPLEYEALRYFDLARQADRIYTRRLGFEPPPVSEDRRLTGELDDVFSVDREITPQLDESHQHLLPRLYRMLTETKLGASLSDSEIALLQQMTAVFTSMAAERPALIQAAALLERLRLQETFDFEGCEDCLSNLRKVTWSSLSSVTALPGKSTRGDVDALSRAYINEVDGYRKRQQLKQVSGQVTVPREPPGSESR